MIPAPEEFLAFLLERARCSVSLDEDDDGPAQGEWLARVSTEEGVTCVCVDKRDAFPLRGAVALDQYDVRLAAFVASKDAQWPERSFRAGELVALQLRFMLCDEDVANHYEFSYVKALAHVPQEWLENGSTAVADDADCALFCALRGGAARDGRTHRVASREFDLPAIAERLKPYALDLGVHVGEFQAFLGETLAEATERLPLCVRDGFLFYDRASLKRDALRRVRGFFRAVRWYLKVHKRTVQRRFSPRALQAQGYFYVQ